MNPPRLFADKRGFIMPDKDNVLNDIFEQDRKVTWS